MAAIEEVRGRAFKNEVVAVDGKKFVDCCFEGVVTFEYEGGYVGISGCGFDNPPRWAFGGALGNGLRAVIRVYAMLGITHVIEEAFASLIRSETVGAPPVSFEII